MREWLRYCRWYFTMALSPDVTIESFFDTPFVNRVDRTDPQLVRFGLLWKVYDMVGSKGLDFQVPILESRPSSQFQSFWILGGVTGADFLVAALGCEQPRAHKGVVSYDSPKTIRYKTIKNELILYLGRKNRKKEMECNNLLNNKKRIFIYSFLYPYSYIWNSYHDS